MKEEWIIALILIPIIGGPAILVAYDMIYIQPQRIAIMEDVNNENNPCYEINTDTTKIVKDRNSCKKLISQLVNDKGWTITNYDQGGWFGQDLVILKK